MDLLLVALLIAIGVVASVQRRRLRPRPAVALPDPARLRLIALRLGLTAEEDRAEGTIDGLTVSIEERDDDRFHLTIDSGGRIPSWLRLEENRLEHGQRAGIGFETRDRFFDDCFLIWAPPVGGAALLDAVVRRSLRELNRVDLERGVLTATITASRAPSVERALRQLLEAARHLTATTSYEQRLMTISTTDQNPFVRLQTLELLADHRGHSDEAQRALWLALDDASVPVALSAAIRLGAPVARSHLKRLARLAASADEERISAFRELLEHEKVEEILPLLLEAARSFNGPFASRALTWVVQHGGRDGLLALLSDPGATQAENLIAFLGEMGKLVKRLAGDGEAKLDAEVEHAVLRILLDTRRRLESARGHAARLLGSCGSPAAIAALKEIGKGELGASMASAKAARDAIARIQARKSAMSGGLALIEESGGDLSFSDAGRGSLSSPQE